MSVKLYNRTKVPDEVVRPVLIAAKSLARCRGKGVVVRVGTGCQGGGQANDYGWVNLAWLQGKRGWASTKRTVRCNGLVEVHFRRHPAIDVLDAARSFLKTAIHEFHHIREFQSGAFASLGNSFQSSGTRRAKWKRRPEEIRAIDATDAALRRLSKNRRQRERVDDLLLALAIELEAL